MLWREYLLKQGVAADEIISVDLDDMSNRRLRHPIRLDEYLRKAVADKSRQYYLFIDEIQMVKAVKNPDFPDDPEEKLTFIDVLNGLRHLPNADVYVSGSNSKMLSSDVATEFRGRGDVIHVNPLTFDEFASAYPGDNNSAWREFFIYGGMPYVMSLSTHEEKSKYLHELFELTYIKDVIERNHLRTETGILDNLLNIVASAVGSLTNPTRLANRFQSVQKVNIKSSTVANYLSCFIDAYVLTKADRFDVKGNVFLDSPVKYYFTDIGLRNARLNFRQVEENHIMENIIYNELKARGFSVDVGVVNHRWNNGEGVFRQSQLEIDFVVNKIDKRYYIQSALTVADEEKRSQETNSLYRIDDYFTRIIVVKDNILPWTDERGVQYINIKDFLLNKINEL